MKSELRYQALLRKSIVERKGIRMPLELVESGREQEARVLNEHGSVAE